MRLFRWAARLFYSTRPSAVRFATAVCRVLAGLLAQLVAREGLFLIGLSLIAAGVWPLSPSLALVLLGLLIIRDAERPDARDKP
jgi:hypothetical protein